MRHLDDIFLGIWGTILASLSLHALGTLIGMTGVVVATTCAIRKEIRETRADKRAQAQLRRAAVQVLSETQGK